MSRRLILARRALARRALALYGLAGARLRFVDHLSGTLFRVDAIAPPTLLMRIMAVDDEALARLRTAVRWLHALSGQTDLCVPAPRPTLDGEWLPTFDEPNGSRLVIMMVTWLDGRCCDRGLTPRHLAALGRFQGELHRHSQALGAGGATQRSMPIGYADAVVEHGLAKGLLTARAVDLVSAAGESIDAALRRLEADGEQAGLIHGDLHPWNVLYHGGVAAAIDFDDCGIGPYSLDMASSLVYLRCPSVGNHDHRRRYPAMAEAFLNGYAAMRTLPQDLDDQLRHGLAARQLALLRWIVCDWPSLDLEPWARSAVATALHELDAYLMGRGRSPLEAAALPQR